MHFNVGVVSVCYLLAFLIFPFLKYNNMQIPWLLSFSTYSCSCILSKFLPVSHFLFLCSYNKVHEPEFKYKNLFQYARTEFLNWQNKFSIK